MTITFSVSSMGLLRIHPDQIVDFKTPLSHQIKSEGRKIYLSRELGIAPDKIFMHLSKVVGDQITIGDIIAEKKSVLGTKRVTSGHEGILKEIDHQEGFVLIESQIETTDQKNAYFVGQVQDIKGNLVTLKVKTSKSFDLKDVTQDFGGEVMFCSEQTLSSLKENDVQHKVIFTEYIKASEAIRLDVLGVYGIITKNNIIEKEGVNSAQIKNVSDWEEIKNLKYSHCLIDKKNNTMYLYQHQ